MIVLFRINIFVNFFKNKPPVLLFNYHHMNIDLPYPQPLIKDEEMLFQINQNGFMARENELEPI